MCLVTFLRKSDTGEQTQEQQQAKILDRPSCLFSKRKDNFPYKSLNRHATGG